MQKSYRFSKNQEGTVLITVGGTDLKIQVGSNSGFLQRTLFLTSIASVYKITHCTAFYRKEYDQRFVKNGDNCV